MGRDVCLTQVAEGEAKEKALADARVEKEKAIAVMQQEQLNAYKVLKETRSGIDRSYIYEIMICVS